MKNYVLTGNEILGIEFGSTRIKAVLIDENNNLLATGSNTWENKFENGAVPCARGLTENEVNDEYELNTGKVIVEEFEKRGIKPEECPAVLVHRHGPFTWGSSPFKAVENALILEEVAKMASRTERIAAFDNNSNIGIEQYLLDKHYQRKHGINAYYGQGN